MAIEPIKGFYVHDEVTDTDGVAKYAYDALVGAPNDLNNIVTNDDLQNGTYKIITPSMHIGTWRETAQEFGPATNRVVFNAIQPFIGTERVYTFGNETIDIFLVGFDDNNTQLGYCGFATTSGGHWKDNTYFDLNDLKKNYIPSSDDMTQYLLVFRFHDNRAITDPTEIANNVMIINEFKGVKDVNLVMGFNTSNAKFKFEITTSGQVHYNGGLLLYMRDGSYYDIRTDTEKTFNLIGDGTRSDTLILDHTVLKKNTITDADSTDPFKIVDRQNYAKEDIPIVNYRYVNTPNVPFASSQFAQFLSSIVVKEILVMLSAISEIYDGKPFMRIYKSTNKIELAGCFYIYTKTGDYYRINCTTVKTFNLTHSQTLVLDLSDIPSNTEVTTDNSDAFKVVSGRAYSDACIPIANVRAYENNEYMMYVTGPFAQFLIDETKPEFDTKTLKLETFKEKYYPYTMHNYGSGWSSRVNLLHVSDTHMATDESYNNLLESISVGNSLYADGVISTVINTGDNTNGGASTLSNFLAQYTKNTNALTESTAPYLMQLGNHDANNGQNVAIADIPTNDDLFPPFENIFAQSGVVAGDATNKKRYYYRDVTQGGHSIRIIMLDMLDHPDYTANSTNYHCQWNVVYSQAQIDWLASVLNSTPANYGVIIGNHFPFAPSRNGYSEEYPALNDGFFVQSPTTRASDGWKMIPEIVDAWQRRTTISKTYNDTVGDQDIVADYNFSDVPSGAEFICYLCGHTHSKNVFRVEEENGDQFDQLMLCEDSSGQNGVALNRVYKHFGTISDNAFSCLAIDMDEKKIYRTSYGVYKKCSDPTVAQTQVFSYDFSNE